MKKILLSTLMSVSVGLVPAVADAATASRTSTSYKTTSTSSVYYKSPTTQRNLYSNYNTSKKIPEVYTKNSNRKYYIAHPFFQPTKGKFGSVTDISYLNQSYDMQINQTFGPALSDFNASWDSSVIGIKQDFSYGITDTFALQVGAKFDMNDYTMDWALDTTPDDTFSDNKLASYGLGAQWRFADTSEWIAMAAAYYQNFDNLGDFITADVKAGYKVGTSTIYGLLRGTYVGFDGNNYGNGFEENGTGFFIAYKSNDDSSVFVEGGLGIFTVLNRDWTMNLEAMIGDYDWSSQGSIKGAIGWQPNEYFALNLYGKAQVYNSADGMDLNFYWYQPAAGINQYTKIGTAEISGNSEMSIGLQTTFYF